MKVKLLKKLRKKAKAYVRIVQRDEDYFEVQEFVSSCRQENGSRWFKIAARATFEAAKRSCDYQRRLTLEALVLKYKAEHILAKEKFESKIVY